MKALFEQEDIRAIAKEVIEMLNPVLAKSEKPEEDIIYDVNGLAQYLLVSKQWVYERTHLKEIPHLKINGQLRFRKRDIDRWLNSYRVPAVKE